MCIMFNRYYPEIKTKTTSSKTNKKIAQIGVIKKNSII